MDAESKVRYEGIKLRKSTTDNVTYIEFFQNEKREMESTDPSKGNLKKCIQMADYVFENDGTVEDLEKKVDEVMRGIL